MGKPIVIRCLMKHNASLLLVLHVGITSCVSSYKMNFINVELMKPPILPHVEKIDTIALFSRDMIRMDTIVYQYFSRRQSMTDSTIQYLDNYNTCLDALALSGTRKYFVNSSQSPSTLKILMTLKF